MKVTYVVKGLILGIILGFEVTETRNINTNEIVPIHIDLGMSLPRPIKVRYSPNIRCNVYEIEENERERTRIGTIYEYGILVYSDSDILVERRVYKLLVTSVSASIIQVNSKYRREGEEIKEIMELIRYPQDNHFREIVRQSFEVNLKTGYINRPEIYVSQQENKLTYQIRGEDRLRYKIGTVKYGDILIDNYQNTVTFKMVMTDLDANGNMVIEVKKVLKTGDHIASKCMIMFEDDPETGFCQELELNVTNLLP